ncbi:MAG TPA: hypothetical protein VGM90_13745 [Kofleriaceae bacterium]|jgi:hypothetical protein
MRLQVGLAGLATILFAACGGGGGGGGDGVDGGGSGSNLPADSFVPPEANCAPLDLGSAAAIPIMNGTITPNPQGGMLHSATFKLTSVKLDVQGITVTGTTKSRVELVVGNATTGAARVAISIDGMALGMALMQDVTGAGLYTVATSNLTVADGCGGTNALPVLSYTAIPTGLTIWTTYQAETQIGTIPVPIELVFATE